jgi:hypothetical protein
MLPAESRLGPSTALAIATSLLQYHQNLGEGLAAAFNALANLIHTEPLRPPLDMYVASALGDLSHRFGLLSGQLIRPRDNS